MREWGRGHAPVVGTPKIGVLMRSVRSTLGAVVVFDGDIWGLESLKMPRIVGNYAYVDKNRNNI